MNILLEGLWVGLVYAIPIGAQNIFVINAASNGGLGNAIRIATVVSLMDVSLAVACFLGVGEILSKWPIINPVMGAVGALFLFYVGISLLKMKAGKGRLSERLFISLSGLIRAAFLLTWFNPQAIIDGTMLFGGVRSTLESDQVLFFIVGAGLGSMLWFFSICLTVGLMKSPIPPRFMIFLNRCCGAGLILYGIKLSAQTLL